MTNLEARRRAVTDAKGVTFNATQQPADAKSSPPQIIIAAHVLLWDNEIVTWEQAVERFRAMRASGPFQAVFMMTDAIFKSNKDVDWSERIIPLIPELFAPTGVSFGGISPCGSRRFSMRFELRMTCGQILICARWGQVVAANGKPAAGVQIVVLPIKDAGGVALRGTALCDPLDEQWTTADEKGQFAVYPSKDEYFIAALHPSGFSLQRGPAGLADIVVRLEPWASVTFSATQELAENSWDITTLPTGTGRDWPYYWVHEPPNEGKPVTVYLPAGEIEVRTTRISVDSPATSSGPSYAVSTRLTRFSLHPGEEHNAVIGPREDKKSEKD